MHTFKYYLHSVRITYIVEFIKLYPADIPAVNKHLFHHIAVMGFDTDCDGFSVADSYHPIRINFAAIVGSDEYAVIPVVTK